MFKIFCSKNVISRYIGVLSKIKNKNRLHNVFGWVFFFSFALFAKYLEPISVSNYKPVLSLHKTLRSWNVSNLKIFKCLFCFFKNKWVPPPSGDYLVFLLLCQFIPHLPSSTTSRQLLSQMCKPRANPF